jgi:alkanesulfonate monooxygenase SsuD/methylene tetrahydromethanopterin reductase-like flavin-dependent oxidoreductase (luciferase family)
MIGTPRRGIAAPCLDIEPGDLVQLGVDAEAAGFDGFFVWDHLIYSNDGIGPDVVDPWTVLAAIAVRTSRITLATMVTPVSRRRPWVLARQCVTLDRLCGGRFVLGVGLGAPDGDFERFGDETDPVRRGDMLDEGLAVLDGLWSGELFEYAGEHYRVAPVRFRPTPQQQPRIPIWVGGVIPAPRPLRRAARWDGYVPIHYIDGQSVRPSVAQIRTAADELRKRRGSLDGYDVAVWSGVLVGEELQAREAMVAGYADAGATWWVETGRLGEGWLDGLRRRIALGP